MNCPVCGCEESVPGMRADGATWQRCSRCGLLFDVDTPIPVFVSGDVPVNQADVKVDRALHGDLTPWHNVVNAVATRFPRCVGGALLEIGCGTGHVLDYAAKRWHRVVGTEIRADYVAFCRDRGHEVHHVDISDPSVTVGQFNLILANQVMEHLVDPPAFMRGVGRHLTADGLFWGTFCIEAPHDQVKRGEAYWWTMRAASTLIENAGLEIFDVEWTHWSYNIAVRKPVRCQASVERMITP